MCIFRLCGSISSKASTQEKYVKTRRLQNLSIPVGRKSSRWSRILCTRLALSLVVTRWCARSQYGSQ